MCYAVSANFEKEGIPMRSGTKHLRIASVMQILLGAASLAATYFMIGAAGEAQLAGISAEAVLGVLVLTYASQAFQILAGICGLALAKKKSLFTVILGVLLFVPQLVVFIHVQHNIALILVNAVMLLIPYYYLHSAWKNYKA